MSIGVPNQVKDLYAQLKAKSEEKEQKLSYHCLLLLAKISEFIHLLKCFAKHEDYRKVVDCKNRVKNHVSIADDV